MSEQAIGPLQQARQQVADLQQRAESGDLTDLTASLSALDDLLKKAVQRGEGEAAEALRVQLETMRDQQARLTSLMVHEIRKPMTSIRGYSDMLAKPGMIGTLNEMQQQFMDVIRANILAMESLVTNISDLNKLNAGRLRLDAKMTTFGQIMMDVQRQAEPLIAEFGHQVTYDVPQGLPILVVDAPQLVKVIMHLLRNAIQYTPKGGQGRITLAARRLEGNLLEVKITDNGIGIKPEDQARFGEPFFRTDHELVTSQKGYGLGLPVVMSLLALMGSKLTFESTPGQGSTFSFILAGK